MQAMEFNIKEAELQAALPRIVSVASATPSASPAAQTATEKAATAASTNEIIILDTPLKPVKIEEKPLSKGSPVKIKIEGESGVNPLEKLTSVKTIMGFKIKREADSKIEEKEQENMEMEPHSIKEEATQHNTNSEPLSIKNEETQETLQEIPKPQMKGTPVKGLLNSLKIEADEESPKPPRNANQTDEEESLLKPTEALSKPLKKGTPVRPRLGDIKVKSNEELLFHGGDAGQKVTPAKPQRKGTPVKKINFGYNNTNSDDEGEALSATPSKTGETEGIEILDSPTPQKPQRKGTPVRIAVVKDSTNDNVRSILTKKRDIFAEDSHKVVKFSESDPIIHNLSPADQVAKENEKPSELEDAKDVKPTIRRPVVRRIVVSSRKPITK